LPLAGRLPGGKQWRGSQGASQELKQGVFSAQRSAATIARGKMRTLVGSQLMRKLELK
jgi:hypothetical protein